MKDKKMRFYHIPYFFHNRVIAPTFDFCGAHTQHVGRKATGGGGGGEKGRVKCVRLV